MKKTIFLLAFACASTSFLFAQPVLQMSVLPDIGDVVSIQEADTNSIAQGNAGANQTWNFSGLQPLSGTTPAQYSYLAPSNTPPQYASSFPTANLAVKIDFDTIVYGYSKKEANQFTFLGIKNSFISQLYPDPDIQLKTLNYGGSFQDNFTNISDAGTGVIFYGTGSRTVTYDGYGTLITPSGTYQNAIRIKSVSSQVDSAEFSGIKIISQTDITTYDWLVNDKPGAFIPVYYIHTVSSTFLPGFPPMVTDLGTEKSANYIFSSVLGAFNRPDALAGIMIRMAGSNPAADELALLVTAENGNENLQMLLTDINGRVIETRSLAVAAGENRLSFPVGHLASGAYFLTLTDGKAVGTLNWQKF